jgi:hypothetical protein
MVFLPSFLPLAPFSRLLYFSNQLQVLLRKEIGSGCWEDSIWGYRLLLGGKDWGTDFVGGSLEVGTNVGVRKTSARALFTGNTK